MSPQLVTLITFLAGVLVVVGIYSVLSDLFLRDRARMTRRVDEEFRRRQRDKVRQSSLFKNLGDLAAEAVADDGENTWRRRFETMVEQSGLDITPRKLMSFAVTAGMICGALTGFLFLNVIAGAAVGLVVFALPLLYVRHKHRSRMNQLLSQLPDAFDLMARVIRAGQTMSQALQSVADEFDPPIAIEFAYCYEQQNLGLSTEVALRDLARRTGLLEIKIFVLAMLVQQQTGGNLAELLDKLSTVVRDRFRLLGKIKALTAEGRFQAAILLALPPFMFLLLMFLNRNYAQVLLEYWGLLAVLFVSETLGALWIRKIIHFDF